jgi:hypothetical protein
MDTVPIGAAPKGAVELSADDEAALRKNSAAIEDLAASLTASCTLALKDGSSSMTVSDDGQISFSAERYTVED